MANYILSYDLGTGGLKTGLFREDGSSVGFDFQPYQTFYPCPDWHEQRPEDWWQAVCTSTRRIIQSSAVDPKDIAAVSSSGHSLVAAPLDREGNLLLKSVPIWSDRRAKEEAREFFQSVNYSDWYLTTGNGDPPETYSVFKILWLRKHHPELFSQTVKFIGSKDYIHYRLTGVMATDTSYASGSGVFDLKKGIYHDPFLAAAGLDRSLLLEPVDSAALIGTVQPAAAELCGLAVGTKVICGGVDNSCMAFGTTGSGEGKVYTSLGSSAWIAVTARKPVLDINSLPFVFAHVEKDHFTSGVSIFTAGSCYRWARENFCADMHGDPFEEMNRLAAQSPAGSNGVMFYPALAGGSSQEPSENIQGSFFGLTLSHTRADLLRSVLEGVALCLRCFCLPVLKPVMNDQEPMIICGGGAKSDLWMQIFADVFDQPVARIQVDQEAASLGAAALAAYGSGMWQDYSRLNQRVQIKKTYLPIDENRIRYEQIRRNFSAWAVSLAEIHHKLVVNS